MKWPDHWKKDWKNDTTCVIIVFKMCAYLQYDFDLGGTPMELQFNREPCLILEATELLYVFVNQL